MDKHDGFLTDEETSRFIQQVVGKAGRRGITEDEILAAHQAFVEMFFAAGAVEAWQKGYLEIGWDAEAKDLVFYMAPQEAARGR